MAKNKYKFYFSKDDVNYESIEDKFDGLLYLKCTGLEDIGKPKNKYTETFADAEELKVYESETVTHEPTDIVFTFLFVGDNRQKAYRSFYEYIKSGKLYYYDTARFKKAYLELLDPVKPSKDEYKGGTPYMQADFKFKNLRGKCESVFPNGN